MINLPRVARGLGELAALPILLTLSLALYLLLLGFGIYDSLTDRE